MELRLVVTIHAKPGKGAELARALSRRAIETRREDGCNQFEAFVSADDADKVVVLERWRDQAALDAHALLLKVHYPPLAPELRERMEREDYGYRRTK